MRVLIACSGGPDSVALVHSLKNLSSENEWLFVIGHINHHLRGKHSDGDELFVRRLAKLVGWPCVVESAPVQDRPGNLEENAREMRYALLEKMARAKKCQLILTAHTLEDQAETIFMNILRGAGPDGLSGIWPLRRKKDGTIWVGRPLLTVSKMEILRYLQSQEYVYRKDRSNQETVFLRNWLRLKLFPQLEKRAPGFQSRLAQLGVLMRGEQVHWGAELKKMNTELLKQHARGAYLDFKKLLRYSAAAQRRFLRSELGGDLLTFEAVEKLRYWMSGPPSGGRHWQLKQGWVVERLPRSQGAPSTSIFLLRKSPKESVDIQ